MPKRQIGGAASDSARARAHAAGGERRGQSLIEPSARPARAEGAIRKPPARQRSVAMQLAAEVERLERELAGVRAQMAELAARADVDSLTDLLNRSAFERELRRSLAHAKRYGSSAALVYLDLDGFKSVNDHHGHGAGDAVLKATATVLLRHVRASDVVARLGGDEFAVLLWHLTETDAWHKAQALEAVIDRTTAIHAGLTLSIRASAGAAPLLPLDEPADVLERADRAM